MALEEELMLSELKPLTILLQMMVLPLVVTEMILRALERILLLS